MGLDGFYLRVTPAELDIMLAAPDRAREIADGLPDDRHLGVHKAWDAISRILEHAGFPVDIVNGERTLPAQEWGVQITDPPGYLDPDRVRTAADALSRTSYDGLTRGLDPNRMAHCYGVGTWDEQGSAWVRRWFDPLIPFFSAAALEGDAVVVWID